MEIAETPETTLGDLVTALTEETTPYVRDKKEAYRVVAFMLMHLLHNSGAPSKVWQIWH